MDDELVFEETYEVPRMEGRRTGSVWAECAWPTDDHGEFTVSLRLNTMDEWETITMDDVYGDDDCQWIDARIEDVGIFYAMWRDCTGSMANPDGEC